MPQFNDLKAAFEWWLENEYPKLSSAEKQSLKSLRNDFVNHDQAVSDKRLREVLSRYFDVKTVVFLEEK
jgi:hypothetical protein